MKEFKAGDKVVIKTWDEMEKEFGVDSFYDAIDCKYHFTESMKHLSGVKGEVRSVLSDGEVKLKCDDEDLSAWTITTDMIKLVEEKEEEKKTLKTEIKVGDRIKIRSWEDMEKEYGVDSDGDIKIPAYFVTNMEPTCDCYATIKSIDDSYSYKKVKFEDWSSEEAEEVAEDYTFSLDMCEFAHRNTYKVGDRVQIREWKDMEAEFGAVENGFSEYIDIFPRFNKGSMTHLCGKQATIKTLDEYEDKEYMTLTDWEEGTRNIGWNFCAKMFIPVEETTEAMVEETIEKKEEKTFKVGDRVTFKEWDEMKEEFGINENGNIDCAFKFTSFMKEYCGVSATIIEIENKLQGIKIKLKDFSNPDLNGFWSFSTDMVKLAEKQPNVETKAEVKFSVGDRVRIKSLETLKSEFETIYGDSYFKTHCVFVDSMRNLCGRTATIISFEDGETSTTSDPKKVVLGDWSEAGNTSWQFSTDMLELVEKSFEITLSTIEREGNRVISTLYSDGVVIGKGVARCNPEDTFDYRFGANLSTERAYEDLEKRKDLKSKADAKVEVKSGKGLIGKEIKAGTKFKVVNIDPHRRGWLSDSYVCLDEYVGKIATFDETFTFTDGGFNESGTFEEEYVEAIDKKNGKFCWRYDEIELV